MLELSCSKGQHVFTPFEQSTSGGIISTSLVLVKALEGILLVAFGVAAVRLEKAGVDKKPQSPEQTGIVDGLLSSLDECGKACAHKEQQTYSGNVNFGLGGQRWQYVTTKRSHGILSSH